MNRQMWLDGKLMDRAPSEKHTELHRRVYEAVGEASMCWSETPIGIFNADNASRISEELIKYIEEYR